MCWSTADTPVEQNDRDQKDKGLNERQNISVQRILAGPYRGLSYMTIPPLDGYEVCTESTRLACLTPYLNNLPPSLHRQNEKRNRHLYHWLGLGDANIRDDLRNRWCTFLQQSWSCVNFHPFLTISQAVARLTEDHHHCFVRLSGTVPGHVALTWWDDVKLRCKHHRFSLDPDTLALVTERRMLPGVDLDDQANNFTTGTIRGQPVCTGYVVSGLSDDDDLCHNIGAISIQ